jgi:hypothetical protein
MVVAQAASATAAAVSKQHNRIGVLWQPQGAVECYACLSPDAWLLNCPQDIAQSSNE